MFWIFRRKGRFIYLFIQICFIKNSFNLILKYHEEDMQWYDNKLYQEASSKEQVCHAGNKGKNEGTDVNMVRPIRIRLEESLTETEYDFFLLLHVLLVLQFMSQLQYNLLTFLNLNQCILILE